MAELTEIIANDFKQASLKVGSIAKEFTIGALHGLYTPFLLSTGAEHAKDRFKKNNLTDWVGQASGSILTQIPLGSWAFSEDVGPLYVGGLAVTNVADYLVHAIKRSRQTEE